MSRSTRKFHDYMVALFVVVSLLVGWLIKTGVEGRTLVYSDEQIGLTFKYPADWFRLPEPGAVIAVTDPQSPGAFRTGFSVRVQQLGSGRDLAELIAQQAVIQGESLALYRVVSMKPFELNGHNGVMRDYAYASDPTGVIPGITSIPRIVRVRELFVPRGEDVYVFTFASGATGFEQGLPKFTQILKTVSIR